MPKISKLFLLATLASGLILSACASKPERRGPPGGDRSEAGERGERGARGKPQGSGTFLRPVAALFIGMDSNKDKVITLAEVDAGAASEWASFNGSPSAIYFNDWSLVNLGSADAMPSFMSFDRDFSGVISESEFSAQLRRQFTQLDKNKDGELTRSEMLVTYNAKFGKSRGGGGNREGGGRGQGGRGGVSIRRL